MRAVPRLIQIEAGVQFLVAQGGQQFDTPTQERFPGQIATGGGTVTPVGITPLVIPDYFPVETPSIGLSAGQKLDLLRKQLVLQLHVP